MMNKFNVKNMNSIQRTKNIKLNITLSLFYKISSAILSFLVVPLTIGYLNNEKYGIWMTLLSLLSWVTFFDGGLGLGLRNKLTEALAKGDNNEAKTYVSTAYFAISIIAVSGMIITFIAVPYINWLSVFNTTSMTVLYLSQLIIIVSMFVFLNFVISLSNSIYFAYQKASLTGISSVLSQLIFFIFIMIIKQNTSENLLLISLIYGLSILFSNLVVSIIFFRKHLVVIPSFHYIEVAKIKDIMGIGIKFFVIQLANLVILTSNNIIITQLFGPEEVTPYNIVLKLFSIITIVHGSVILTTLWSSYTEAYEKKDYLWIKNTMEKMCVFLIPVMIATIVLMYSGKSIIQVWIGNTCVITEELIVIMAVYTIIVAINGTFIAFLNGITRINLQLILCVMGAIINIPLSIYMGSIMNMGSAGILVGSILSYLPCTIILPIQSYIIIYKKFKYEEKI